MSIFSSVKIGQAASDYSKFDLSNNVMSTLDFAQIIPINSIECNIGDKFKYDFKSFTRVAPMVFPTFGDIGMRSVIAFVPYYTVSDDVDTFLSGITHFGGSPSSGRFFYQADLNTLFWGSIHSENIDNSTSSPYLRPCTELETNAAKEYIASGKDLPRRFFSWKGSSGAYGYFTFTWKGKYLYKILRSLGYDISQYLDFSTNNPSGKNKLVLNAFPLLCYFKMYADLMLPTAYYQTSPLLALLHGIKSKNSDYVNSAGFINNEKVHEVLSILTKVFYDSDYFTTAWQSPNSPLSSALPSVTTFDETVNRVDLDADSISNKMTIMGGTLSQTQLSFLRSFDNFVRRNNLVGYREFNAIYARYGIKPSEMKSNYCQLLDIRNLDLNVGDVTATSQSDGTVLGSYAGKGFINGGSSIDFECKDFGMIVHMIQLYVKPVYFQGIRKRCLRKDAFDFYQPEFDGVGPQPISKVELHSAHDDTVFGYTERYNEYRYSLDNIIGDFAVDENMFPWHTGRVFDYKSSLVAQSDGFLRYGVDAKGNSEFDRVFSTQNVDNPFDHFYQVWRFNVSALRKMKNISAALNLGVGNIQLDRNGSV